MMLIPGQISRNTYTFQEPGEHLIICHEYCGIAHHTMYGRLIVE
jgi:cytochrome c oxidase subunit 2